MQGHQTDFSNKRHDKLGLQLTLLHSIWDRIGVDEGDLQVVSIDVDVILEKCPITSIIRNLLVYSKIQCSTIVILLYEDGRCHRTTIGEPV